MGYVADPRVQELQIGYGIVPSVVELHVGYGADPRVQELQIGYGIVPSVVELQVAYDATDMFSHGSVPMY